MSAIHCHIHPWCPNAFLAREFCAVGWLIVIAFPVLISFVLPVTVNARPPDTLTVVERESKYDSTIYKRIILYDTAGRRFHVTDIYLSGQVAMTGDYLTIDPMIKEEFWNYHHTHVKHGYFRKWYDNGNIEWEGQFVDGMIHGSVLSWYKNGQIHFTGQYDHGMQDGRFTYWNEDGAVKYRIEYDHGRTLQPPKVRYDYLVYLPRGYEKDPEQKWPTIVFLHGGSDRGSDLKKVKSNGIPDQIERGRNLPFIVIAPQCPADKRWETDDWFDSFLAEIKSRYRIDTNRVYLTGLSLGATGTWYLAMKYPSVFAAIAPVSGRTMQMKYLADSVCNLAGIPLWLFHSLADEIVDMSESIRIARMLDSCGIKYRFSRFDGYSHWRTQWEVYGGDDLYNWFLQCRKNERMQSSGGS